MKYINNSINITSLAIPGTHNSCSDKFHNQTNSVVQSRMINQVWTINEQLNAGIRYFDLRPGYKYIYHGKYSTIYTLDYVLNLFIKFLEKNPSEFLFVRFQYANSSCKNHTFCIENYVVNVIKKYDKYFYKLKEFPIIKDIRGKIYPFVEFFEYSNFTNWTDSVNKTFYLQDFFELKIKYFYQRPREVKKKRNLINEYIKLSKNRNNNKLIINHCSAKNKYIQSTSFYTSLMFNEVPFKEKNFKGIFVFDFPSELLIKHIIQQNF